MSGIIGGAGSKSGMIGWTEIDYEEGEWTPVLQGSSGSSTPAEYSSRSGFYTKTGNVLNLWWNINVNVAGSHQGSYMMLKGFPYYSDSASWWGSSGGPMYFQGMNANTMLIWLQISTNDAYILFKDDKSGDREYMPTSHLTSSTQLHGHTTIFTA